jgi:uncharacterized membrane protein
MRAARPDGAIPSTTRIEAFSDGVIAIALTILVLELKVPEIGASLRELDIARLLEELLPRVGAYLLSFLIIAIYWVNHHHMFHLLESTDAGLLWHNNHLLLWLSLLSFPTALLGEHPDSRVVAVVYGAVSLMTALAFCLLHRHAFRSGLFSKAYTPEAFAADASANLRTLGLYGACILLALVSPFLAEAGLVLVALLYFVPRVVAR